jgi:hypothetical protein
MRCFELGGCRMSVLVLIGSYGAIKGEKIAIISTVTTIPRPARTIFRPSVSGKNEKIVVARFFTSLFSALSRISPPQYLILGSSNA